MKIINAITKILNVLTVDELFLIMKDDSLKPLFVTLTKA